MDVNEMLWAPHGSLSIRWEHGEPYHEAYGGIVPCVPSPGRSASGRRACGGGFWNASGAWPRSTPNVPPSAVASGSLGAC